MLVIIGGVSYFLAIPYKDPPREFEIHWATSKAHREMPQSIKKFLLENCEYADDSPELVKVSLPNWNCSKEPLEITRLIVEELNSGYDVDCLTDRLELNMENLCLCSVNSGNSPPIGETYVYPVNGSLKFTTNTGREILSDFVNVKIVDLEGF